MNDVALESPAERHKMFLAVRNDFHGTGDGIALLLAVTEDSELFESDAFGDDGEVHSLHFGWTECDGLLCRAFQLVPIALLRDDRSTTVSAVEAFSLKRDLMLFTSRKPFLANQLI